jgi:hypothetical protein
VLETYISSEGSLYKNLIVLDYIINAIFILEFIIKVISLGFFMDYNSYLKNNWNQLDFIIVCISILEMVFSEANLDFIKTIRLLRILRPLKFISHNPNMRIIVNCLL